MPNNNRLVVSIFVEGSNRSIILDPLNAMMPIGAEELEGVHGKGVRDAIGKAVLAQIMMQISLPSNQERYARIIGEKINKELDSAFAIPN